MRAIGRDHPRMRGEDVQEFGYEGDWAGSPPHARGRHHHHQAPQGVPGITPACAGKTPPRTPPPSTDGDHPRMRGEDIAELLMASSVAGSPPHARGRLGGGLFTGSHAGITPACAGKTCPGLTGRSNSSDHPRMRGEDETFREMQGIAAGSPPHARGRPHSGQVLSSQRGITPACAGKTRRESPTRKQPPDHPRMRGEDRRANRVLGAEAGSPPHARGRHRAGLRLLNAAGITPACAGKTRTRSSGRGREADHPRMRGEDVGEVRYAAGHLGSPPHARGRPGPVPPGS